VIYNNIKKSLKQYNKRFGNTDSLKKLELLINTKINIADRKNYKGHVTCGAIVIDKNDKFLMINHLTLDKWLFPGGHIEKNDKSLREAAIRELTEETGLSTNDLKPFNSWLDNEPIYVDYHKIPENIKKNEKEHSHWDFKYLFQVEELNIKIDTNEVKGYKAVSIDKAPKYLHEKYKYIM